MILGHEPLGSFYTFNFQLMQYHGYRLAEIEGMFPFERELYLAMIAEHVEKERKKHANKQ